MKTKLKHLALGAMAIIGLGVTSVNLSGMLGLTTATATVIMTVIDTYSTIATIVSILAVFVGAGIVSTGLVIMTKKTIAAYGKAYAIAW